MISYIFIVFQYSNTGFHRTAEPSMASLWGRPEELWKRTQWRPTWSRLRQKMPVWTLQWRTGPILERRAGGWFTSRFPCCVLSYFSLVFVMEHNWQIQVIRVSWVGQSTSSRTSRTQKVSAYFCSEDQIYFQVIASTFDCHVEYEILFVIPSEEDD